MIANREKTASKQQPEMQIHWHSDIKHLQKATLRTPLPMAVTVEETEALTKRCTCRAKSSATLQHVTLFYATCAAPVFHTNLTPQASIQNLLQKLPPMAWPYRSHSSTCERLQPFTGNVFTFCSPLQDESSHLHISQQSPVRTEGVRKIL